MKIESEKSEKKDLIRCFIAIEISREAINYVEELQKLIKKQNLFYGKFVDPENLHLTLKFLGEIEENKVEEVKNKLKNIKFKEFEISLGEVGYFTERFLRIIWLKINGKELWALQKEVNETLKNYFNKEEKFMSHLTIARIKKVSDKKAFLSYIKNIKTKNIKFKINKFILKKSELKPEGPIYTDIEKYSAN